MQEEHKARIKTLAGQLETIKADCTQILQHGNNLNYICIMTGRILPESAKSMANTIVNELAASAPNDMPEQLKLESLLRPLTKVREILSYHNLKDFVKLDDGRHREIDARMTWEDFKTCLLAEICAPVTVSKTTLQ